MRFRNKVVLIIFFSILIVPQSISAQSRLGYGEPLATYEASEGFKITSYSHRWNTYSKLKEVGDELLSNVYAEEISYLKNIYLYPDSPDGVLAYTHYDLARGYQGNYTYKDDAYIEIFDANQYNNVRDMAWVLSHEYGHHFTIYHLIQKENRFFDQWKSTGYAQVRNIVDDPDITYQQESIGDSYRWDIMEMAAEDYVQIFGSANARRSIVYKDIQQRNAENIGYNFNYRPAFNMKPQDNLERPLAADVAGLETYWRSLANLPKKVKSNRPTKPRLRLVTKKEISRGYYQYMLEWDKIPGNKEYEYTLVSYPDGEYMLPFPVKTVMPGEDTYAIIGNDLKMDMTTGGKRFVLDDYTGRYTFKLYVKDSDNKIYSGSSLDVNFNYPDIEYKGLYKDMHPTNWSYDAAQQLYGRGIMVGSPDRYFYPLKGVNYDEFAAILVRAYGSDITWGDMANKRLELLKEKQYLTRDDVGLLLYQFLQGQERAIKDVNRAIKLKDYDEIANKKEMTYLHNIGVVGGSNGCYYPSNNITRQELAAMIFETLKLINI